MAKKYTYTNTKTGKVLFETIEPHYVSIEDVDKKMTEATKNDPRLDPFIERQIRVVPDGTKPYKAPRKVEGRFDKSKKTKGFI